MNILGSTEEERTGATVTYLLLAVFSWLGALVGWLVWKGKGAYAKEQTTEALNFGLTILIAWVVVAALSSILNSLHFLRQVLWVVELVFGIVAAMAAYKGENYRFPYALRLVK